MTMMEAMRQNDITLPRTPADLHKNKEELESIFCTPEESASCTGGERGGGRGDCFGGLGG